MTEVETIARDLERFRPLVGEERTAQGLRVADRLRPVLQHRVVWNINSTATGGGVAEMLRALLGYVRGAGFDCRWVAIDGDADFFRVTKRLHHSLHGSLGDGSPLDEEAHRIYRRVCDRNAAALLERIAPDDVVLLHDPQTAGLADALIDRGAVVLWRCHIGHTTTDPEVEAGWHFLQPYLQRVPAFVFSRRAYVPPYCDHGRSTVITPSIDAFSPKNQDLSDATVRAILVRTGILSGSDGGGAAEFVRENGERGRVERRAEIVRVGDAPMPDTPLVVQVSRWDPLKDPVGVVRGFAALVAGGGAGRAELMMVGPDVTAVADDPEGVKVLDEVKAEWARLPEEIRRRVHLVSLPMADVDENAAMVNAIQRHATIVVQKSLHEGFGLTVTEAMWKARPVVAGAVGGICDQITNGVHGVLLRDPADVFAFAAALQRVLADKEFADGMGMRARERVRERFLGFQHLVKYARLIARLDRQRRSS